MTEALIEAVARAICRQNLLSTHQHDDDATMATYWPSFTPEARAISAVPEMMEALEKAQWLLRAICGQDGNYPDEREILGLVKAALAKARGETP